jgi:hypothetical protein
MTQQIHSTSIETTSFGHLKPKILIFLGIQSMAGEKEGQESADPLSGDLKQQ